MWENSEDIDRSRIETRHFPHILQTCALFGPILVPINFDFEDIGEDKVFNVWTNSARQKRLLEDGNWFGTLLKEEMEAP